MTDNEKSGNENVKSETQKDIRNELTPFPDYKRRVFSLRELRDRLRNRTVTKRIAYLKEIVDATTALERALSELERVRLERERAIKELQRAREISELDAALRVMELEGKLELARLARRPFGVDADGLKPLFEEDYASVDVPKQITSTIYLHNGTREQAEELSSLVEQVILELGYEKEAEGELIAGSWVKRIFFRLKKTTESEEVAERAKVIEDLLFGHASVDVDEKIVTMTANLLSSLDQRSSAAAIDTGLFLFLKVPDDEGQYQILAKRLTVRDRMILNQDPTLIGDPVNILHRLKEARMIPPEKITYLRELGSTKPEELSADQSRLGATEQAAEGANIHGSHAQLRDKRVPR